MAGAPPGRAARPAPLELAKTESSVAATPSTPRPPTIATGREPSPEAATPSGGTGVTPFMRAFGSGSGGAAAGGVHGAAVGSARRCTSAEPAPAGARAGVGVGVGAGPPRSVSPAARQEGRRAGLQQPSPPHWRRGAAAEDHGAPPGGWWHVCPDSGLNESLKEEAEAAAALTAAATACDGRANSPAPLLFRDPVTGALHRHA